MIWRLRLFILAVFTVVATATQPKSVSVVRVPNSGLQPQVVIEPNGTLDLLYFSGDPKAGNLFFVRSQDFGISFSAPLQVNSQSASAIASGTIRGGQLAFDASGRVHVAWNGSGLALPRSAINPATGEPDSPMLYTRLNDKGTAFEPQRNLMSHTFGLDGGGSIAADAGGNVFVAWHGKDLTAPPGEAGRKVWIATSRDSGKTFSSEEPAWTRATGACGCCGMAMFATHEGTILAAYRSATANVHRDIYLLASEDHAKTFRGSLIHPWQVNACPMSSMAFCENAGATFVAWETGGQVYYGRISGRGVPQPIAAPGEGTSRKHPRLATNRRGETILVWTEGTGWQRGGSIAWQVFDSRGNPLVEKGVAPGLPAWSFAAVVALPNDGFAIFY